MTGDATPGLEEAVDLEVLTIRERLRNAEIAAMYRLFYLDLPEEPDPRTGQFHYAEVGPAAVPTEVRVAVARAVRWASDDLLLPVTPAVLWFVPETDADRAHVARYGVRDWDGVSARRRIDGLTHPGDRSVIWIRATLPATRAVLIAAHECRHLEQHPDNPTNEVDATRYAHRVSERILRACHL